MGKDYTNIADGSVFDVAERILGLFYRHSFKTDPSPYITPPDVDLEQYEAYNAGVKARGHVVTEVVNFDRFNISSYGCMKIDLALEIITEAIEKYRESLRPVGMTASKAHVKNYHIDYDRWLTDYSQDAIRVSGVEKRVRSLRFCADMAFNETDVPVFQLQSQLEKLKNEICVGWAKDGDSYYKEANFPDDSYESSKLRDILTSLVTKQMFFNAYSVDSEHIVSELILQHPLLDSDAVPKDGSHPFWQSFDETEYEAWKSTDEESPLSFLKTKIWTRDGYEKDEMVLISKDVGGFFASMYDLQLPGLSRQVV